MDPRVAADPPVIRLEGVVKEFGGGLRWRGGGPVRALDGVTLRVEPGAAVGVAGPNGAGKSTLLRLLLGYVRPTMGEVAVGGMPPRRYVERHGVGYVSELIAIPPAWTVGHAMRTFAALAEVADERRRTDEVLDLLSLGELRSRTVGTLSKGNLQRLALAQALLAPRKVMILDEPSHGLDPEWTARIRERVAEWRAADPERVLLVASHNLEEMEQTVDRVLVLKAGRLCAELSARAPESLVVRVDPADAGAVEARFPGAVGLPGAPGAFRLPAGDRAQTSRRLGELLAGGAVLRELREERAPLLERVRAALLAPEGEP